MAVDLSTLVRGASGVLFVLLGAACTLLARRQGADRVFSWALSLFALGFGGAFIIVNVNAALDERSTIWLAHAALAAWTLALAAALVLAMRAMPSDPREIAVAVALGIAHAAAGSAPLLVDTRAAILGQNVPPEAQLAAYLSQVALRFVTGALVATAFAFLARALAEPEGRVPFVLLSIAFALYPALLQGFSLTTFVTPYIAVQHVVGTLVIGVLVVRWFVSAERGLGRVAIVAAAAVATAVFVAMVESALVENTLARYTLGVGRSIAAALIAIAVLRHDVLRSGLTARTADRATRATMALAALFVVAQVAQNYLSSLGGLVLGGLVAGALLFAATPLQQALEGRGSNADAKLATYRDAVRYALRDGAVTRKEETHLTTLAQQLGIGAADALRARHEVEDEQAAAKRKVPE